MVSALRPRSGPIRSYRFPKFFDETLPNGLRLLTAPVTKLPVVTVLVAVDAGSSNDPLTLEGVAALTARTLVEGTARHDGAELAEKFEQLGTSLETGADWDSAVLKLTVLAENLPPALELLGEVIAGPAFPAREVERLKAERLAEILQLETEPRGLADEKFSELVYSEQSRYSKPDGGSAASVDRLGRTDIEQFYRSSYSPSVSTVIMAGAVTPEINASMVSRFLKGWAQNPAAQRTLTAIPRFTSRNIHIVHKNDAPQSELRVGHVGLPRRHPDFFPAMVMNAVLGGLFGSRINLNLREVHGYTYGASSYFDWRRNAGPFVIATAVASDVTAAALREILLEIDRMRTEKISDLELTLATDYLDGVFPIRYETTSAIASALASTVVYGLPGDYYDSYRKNIRRVSSEDVLRAARSYIHPEQLQVLIVGDGEKIRDSITALDFGPVRVHNG